MTRNSYYKKSLVLLVALASLNCCTDAFVGTYEDPKTVEILDENWNETDERKTAEVLVKSLLESGGWIDEFMRKNPGTKPAVVVDEISNQTSEHINVGLIGRIVRNNLIKSGKVDFVNKSGREKIINELRYQKNSGFVDPVSAKNIGKQIGADFMLTGSISSQEHFQGQIKTVSYITMMELTEFETARISWADEYQIKKRFKKSSAKW